MYGLQHPPVSFEILKVGDIIVYEAFGGERRKIVIDYLDEEIKNERSGFSGRLLDENDNVIIKREPSTLDSRPEIHVWGYHSQITEYTGRNINNV